MKELIRGGITPQKKLAHVANRFGNKALAKQQGSTIVIYDTLPIDGRTEFNFFENANSRSFPFTNLQEGKLNVGEGMIISRMYLSIITVDKNSGAFKEVQPLGLSVTSTQLESGEITITQANSVILKKFPVLSFVSEFNKSSEFSTQSVVELDTQLSLQPLLEFQAKLRSATVSKIDNTYLRLTFEGAGALFSPRANF